jgi:hypothetical protein
VRYCSISPGEPTTPNVSFVGGSRGADEVALDDGSVGDELGLDDSEDDEEPQAARAPVPRRAAAAARSVVPRFRPAQDRTAETLTAGP